MSFVPRIFVNESLEINKEIQLREKKHHYLYNVMKLKLNDDIILVNGKDGEFNSKISFINNKYINLIITQKIKNLVKENFLGLICPIIQNIDIVLKSATEIGVTDFYFVKTAYSKNIKYNKIEGNIIEAIEQCERTDFPIIHKNNKLTDTLNLLNNDKNIIFFCEERSKNNNFKNIIKNIEFKNKNIYVLIGPEAGFSKNEIKYIKSYKNTYSINLGNNILRTETATISILSLIKNIILI